MMKYLVNYILVFVLVSGCVNNTATVETNSEFDAGMAMFEKNKASADKTFNLSKQKI